MQGEVDPLAVILGAESLDEALSAFDSLTRLADQDRSILSELREARLRLQQSVRTLARRSAEVRRVVAQAEAEQARLEAVRSEQEDFLAGVGAQQALNSRQIADLSAQAAEAARAPAPAPATEPGPDPAPTPDPSEPQPGGEPMVVDVVAYCGGVGTASGLPLGWGTVAVDTARLSVRHEDVHPGLRRRASPRTAARRSSARSSTSGSRPARRRARGAGRRSRSPFTGSAAVFGASARPATSVRPSEARIGLVTASRGGSDVSRRGSALGGEAARGAARAARRRPRPLPDRPAEPARGAGRSRWSARRDNGREALRLVRELAPDVVVMDLNMPGMTGVEATRQITAHRAAAPASSC